MVLFESLSNDYVLYFSFLNIPLNTPTVAKWPQIVSVLLQKQTCDNKQDYNV